MGWAEGALVVKNPPANAADTRDPVLIPGSGRSPVEGNGNPLQYSCLANPMDRGTWQVISPWGLKESDATGHLSAVRDCVEPEGYFGGSKITDGDCSHEIERHLLLGRKVMTNLAY